MGKFRLMELLVSGTAQSLPCRKGVFRWCSYKTAPYIGILGIKIIQKMRKISLSK